MSDDGLDPILRKAGVVSDDAISRARAEAEMRHRKLPEILIDMGLVDEKTLAGLIARVGSVALVDPIDRDVVRRLAGRFPTHLARRHLVVPAGEEDGTLVVAAVDPFEPGLAELLASTTGMTVRLVAGVRSAIEATVLEVFGADEEAEITLLGVGAGRLELQGEGDEPVPFDRTREEAGNERVEGPWDDDDSSHTIVVQPRSAPASTEDETTAPSRQAGEVDRMAHVERQLLSISRALALIQVRLDAIDEKVAELAEAARLPR